MDLLPAHFQTAEVQQVVHQVQQGLGIPVHGIQAGIFPGSFLFLHQAFERQDDQAERRPQFMGDVRKEAELHLIQFLFLPAVLRIGLVLKAAGLPVPEIQERAGQSPQQEERI